VKNTDSTWYKGHSFTKGYFWSRLSDKIKIYIGDLDKRCIEFEDFPNLEVVNIEKIVNDIKEERRKREEFIDSNIKEFKPFNEISMPIIKNIPKNDIRDFVKVQPITPFFLKLWKDKI
jgi:hypothetical protein